MLQRVMVVIATLVAVIGLGLSAQSTPAFASAASPVAATASVSEANGWVFTSAAENKAQQERAQEALKVNLKAKVVLYGCANNTVCLYQWITYGGGRWSSTFANFWNHTNDCINLQSATWANTGASVSDNSASMIINGVGTYPATRYATIHNFDDCLNSQISSYPGDRVTGITNLSSVPFGGGTGQNAYHNIASVSFH